MIKRNYMAMTAMSGALLLAASNSQAAMTDVAVNGGFETGDFSNWTEFPGGGTQTITSPGSNADGAASTFAFHSAVPIRAAGDPAVDNVLKNTNLAAGFLTPGASVTVTWDMKGELIGAGGVIFVELFSELTGGGVSKAEIFGDGPLAPSTGWTSHSWTTDLGPDVSGGVTLQLKTSCGQVEGCAVDAYFDNITITTDVSAVPVPAAAWLFGSAMLGLAGLKRKKAA